jgi:hypothetical protein
MFVSSNSADCWYTTGGASPFLNSFVDLNPGSLSRHFVIALGDSTP